MKTTSLFFLGVMGLCSFFSVGQSVATASLTSGGLQSGTAGTNSAYYGYQAGKISTAANNVFIGHVAGKVNVTGAWNTFIGSASGQLNTGSGNTFIGSASGFNTTSGLSNTFVGRNSGLDNLIGASNCYLGFNTGSRNLGSNNVFIGASAGPVVSSTLNDMLMIDNTATLTPLIWGDFTNDQVKLNGKVGIGAVGAFPINAGGVNVSNYRLFVTGGILTEEVRILASTGGTTWADYVFAKDYNLKPLSEVEQFIADKGHLPNVPSAQEVKENGIALGEMAKIQQEKIEELTLYLIQQNKEIEVLKVQMQSLLEKK